MLQEVIIDSIPSSITRDAVFGGKRSKLTEDSLPVGTKVLSKSGREYYFAYTFNGIDYFCDTKAKALCAYHSIGSVPTIHLSKYDVVVEKGHE